MLELDQNVMYDISGGATITGTFINAITKAASFIYQIGQAVGSSIRRVAGGTYCPMS